MKLPRNEKGIRMSIAIRLLTLQTPTQSIVILKGTRGVIEGANRDYLLIRFDRYIELPSGVVHTSGVFSVLFDDVEVIY